MLPTKYLGAAAAAGLGGANGMYSHMAAVRKEVEHENFERDRASAHEGNNGRPTAAPCRPSGKAKENAPNGMTVKSVSRFLWPRFPLR